ncbi:MAG: hypothetical protein SF339_28160, partial [Blastocatellia bacterium]|nr:hypothetical protein [Blastocatellia bacterium]
SVCSVISVCSVFLLHRDCGSGRMHLKTAIVDVVFTFAGGTNSIHDLWGLGAARQRYIICRRRAKARFALLQSPVTMVKIHVKKKIREKNEKTRSG